MQARHELLGGKVQVYRRPNSPYWHCSASIGGRQHRISSKQEGLSQAKDFAEDWFLTLKGKDRFGGGLPSGKTFRKAADKFIDEFEVITGGERSPRYVESLRLKINKHLNPFFGDKPVSHITEGLIQEYRVHRAKAVDKDGNPKPPARTTIHIEMICLGHILKTAKRHGWLAHLPSLAAPYKASGKVSHRAWFSQEEYKKLWRATQARAKNPPNPKWRWECEQLHDFVLFVANTGLRPDEACRLEFRDVTITQDDEPVEIDNVEELNELIERSKKDGLGEPILEIDVRGKRGVGFCKSMPGAVRPYLRLKNRLRAEPEDRTNFTRDRRYKPSSRRARGTEPERVRGGNGGFSRGKGSVMAKPGLADRLFPTPHAQLLNTVLGELGLKFDRDGQVRTAYSLRHTYICFRLIEGADIYQVAKNCRTSVEMIEKYYAQHIKHLLDASAINVRRVKTSGNKTVGSMTAEEVNALA